MQRQSLFNGGKSPNESLICRALIFIGLRVINEVGLIKPTFCIRAGGLALRNDGANLGFIASLNFFTFKITTVCNRGEFLNRHCRFGLLRHLAELRTV